MHWSDIEEIVEYNFGYLKEVVLPLSEFEGQEVEVSDNNLKQILESWIEVRTEE